jgi:hypothetical protein
MARAVVVWRNDFSDLEVAGGVQHVNWQHRVDVVYVNYVRLFG